MLLYMAFNKILPAINDIAPVTRAIVWTNFFTITECTFAYFIAIRLYKVKQYTEMQSLKHGHIRTLEREDSIPRYKSSIDKGDPLKLHSDEEATASTPELELDQQDLVNLKLLGLKVKLPGEQEESLSLSSLRGHVANFSSDEDHTATFKKGKLKKGAFRSDTMLDPVRRHSGSIPKSALVVREKAATIGYAKVPIKEQDEEETRDIEPKIRIVGGKVNISLSSKDLVKLCKSSSNSENLRSSIPINLSLDKLSVDKLCSTDSVLTPEDREVAIATQPPLLREKNRVKFEEDTDPKNRHSMQFVKSFSYSQLNSSDCESETESAICDLEHSGTPSGRSDPSQYVSKISLV